MQTQHALERRQHPRREASIVISYRPTDRTARHDITHTQDISRGGMLLTTARAFAPGALLMIVARLPFPGSPQIVQGTAAAVKSKEIVPRLIYETRVQFVDLDRRSSQIIGDFCAGKADQFALTG